MRTLSDLKAGECGCVSTLEAERPLKRRLMDMGFTHMIPVKVVRLAPLGDPMEVELRGCQLCMRRSDAEHITMAEAAK